MSRDPGMDGRVVVWFFIDEEGHVRVTRVHESSGQRALDTAALEVADVFEFTPALNNGRAGPGLDPGLHRLRRRLIPIPPRLRELPTVA